MEHRPIGCLSASVIGLGCNQIGSSCDAAKSEAIVRRGIELGITFLDTAEEYGDGESERVLGKILRGQRDRVVIATKFAGGVDGRIPPGSASSAAITGAIEGSLRRLQTDYIDLYQLHFPDPATPMLETLTALNAMVRTGKVREIGCCNLNAEQIDQAARLSAEHGLRAFASAQNRLNLLRQEALADVLPACARHGMAFIPFFPLAAGLLTGKYRKGAPPPPDTRLGGRYVAPETAARILSDTQLDRVDRLQRLAAECGRGAADLAIAWLLAQPQVATAITGATRPEQLEANARSAEWRLSAAVADAASEKAVV